MGHPSPSFHYMYIVLQTKFSSLSPCTSETAVKPFLIRYSMGAGLIITAVLCVAPCTALQLFQTNAEMMPYAKTYCVIRCASRH